MKLETVRLIKAALADGTHGINAQIAGLTLDGSDARPSNPTVYTDVDDKFVARRRVGDDDTSTIAFPALVVFQLAPLQAVNPEVHVVLRDVELAIGFRYLLNKQDSAAATRDALYFNRALMRWFNWFMSQDPNGSTRTKNGIVVARCSDFTQSDVHEDWESADAVAASDAVFFVREASP